MKRSVYLKGGTLFLLLLLFMTVPKEAKADLIWTPHDDFFIKHHDECTHVGREYTANGKKGYVSMYRQPGSFRKVDNYVNGTVLYISFSYKDKKSIWGVFQENRDAALTGEEPITGWIRMDQLVVVYDNISFTSEHESEFKEYNGEYNSITFDKETSLPLWTYPGSEVIQFHLPFNRMPDFKYTYTDGSKMIWGFTVRGWICISDPLNENIPSINAKTPATLIPANPEAAAADASINENKPILFLVLGLVVILSIATAILIRIFWRKNKN